MGRGRKPWPPKEPDALGFFGSSAGGALLVFAGTGLHYAHEHGAGLVATGVAGIIVAAVTTFVVYCVSRLFKLPRNTWVVGLLAIIPGVLALRAAHARGVRADAYATLWQVCSGTPVAAAAPLEGAHRRAALFAGPGAHWEPLDAWIPSDVGSTAIVGCPRACGTELRVARTGEVLGCARAVRDLALLIEPVER